jgi:hypothetical protein
MMRIGTVILSLLAGVCAANADEPVSFKGKTITMVVDSAAGGGTDTAGRLIASVIANHLPGKPAVIVHNIPGAEGITAMNYFVKQVAPDGLTVMMASTTQADPLLYRRPQAQYDPTTLVIVGGIGRGGSVLMVRKDAQARLSDKSSAPLNMGGLSGVPRSGMQMAAWGIELLGWNAKWVLGYRGTDDLMIALERGEIDMTTTANLFKIQKFMDSGNFVIESQTGSLRKGQAVARPEFGGAPLFATLVQSKIKDPIVQRAFDYWASMTALDKWLALPPGSPQAVVDAYRDAYVSASADPEFADLGRRVSDNFEPVSYEDVHSLISTLAATPPEAFAYIRAMFRRQGIGAE